MASMPIYPTEIWISVIFMLFMFGVVAILMFSPFMPFIKAKFGKKKLLFTIDRSGDIKMMAAELRNGLYIINGKPMRFLKQYASSYRLAGVNVDFVHMDVGFVMKPEFQAGVAELEEKYNIKSYKDLRKALATKVITRDQLELPLFFTIPIQNLVTYAANVPPTSIQAEIDELFESQKLADLQGLGKYLPWIIILAILMLAAAVAIKIAS